MAAGWFAPVALSLLLLAYVILVIALMTFIFVIFLLSPSYSVFQWSLSSTSSVSLPSMSFCCAVMAEMTWAVVLVENEMPLFVPYLRASG